MIAVARQRRQPRARAAVRVRARPRHRGLGVGHGARAVRRGRRVPGDRRRARCAAPARRCGPVPRASAPNATRRAAASSCAPRSLLVALLTATAIASRIGDDAVAAHQICMQVLLFLALVARRARDRRPGDGRPVPRRVERARRARRRAAHARARGRRRRRCSGSWSWLLRPWLAALFTDDAGVRAPHARRCSGSSPRCSRSPRWCSCSTACSSAPATPATSRWRCWSPPSACTSRPRSLVAVLDAGLLWLWGALALWMLARFVGMAGRFRDHPMAGGRRRTRSDVTAACVATNRYRLDDARVTGTAAAPGRHPTPTSAAAVGRAGAAAPTTTGRPSTSSLATSTPGAAASPCARSPARSTTRSTATGSGPSGRASSTCRSKAARCSSPTTAARSRRTRRSIMHGIETELLRPVYGLAENLFRSLPGARHAVVARRRRARAPRQRVPAAARRPAARARVPRGHQGHRQARTATATSCAASGAAGSSRSRCAPACRSCRSRSSATRRRCRSSGRATRLAKLLGLPYFPITANQFVFGPLLGYVLPLPAKFRIRVLPPITFDVEPGPGALQPRRRDGARRSGSARSSRPRSTTCCATVAASGSAERRGAHPRHRARHVLGQPHRAGARAATRRRARSSASTRASRACRSSAPSSCRPTRRTRSCGASCGRRRSTPSCTRTSTSTPRASSSRRAARDQRDRHHEPARGRRRPTGSPVRKVVLKTSTLVYGSNFDDPYFFRETTRRTRPPTTPVERSLLEVDAFVRDFAEDNPHVAVTSLRFANVLGDDLDDRVLAHAAHAGRARGVRLRPAPAVRARGRRHRARSRTRRVHDVPGMFNVAGDGIDPVERGVPRGRRVGAWRCRRCSPARPRCRCGSLRVVDIPPEVLSLLRYGRGVDTGAFVDAGFQYGYTTPARSRRSRAPRGSSGSSARRPSTSTSATSRPSSATPARWCDPRADGLSAPT